MRDLSISREVRDLCSELIALRRDFHANPELGFEERRTSRIVEAYLKKAGISTRRICGTGILALVRGSRPGKTILLRADMDALPVQEQNRVPYASRSPGKMHACGHDGHTAIALVTAKLLHRMRDDLRGNVKLMFQPAEEGPGGAGPMLKEGILNDPQVDYAFALHLWNDLPVGKVGVRPGPVMAGASSFRAVIEGRGGHGAQPHRTIDPVSVAAAAVMQLQTIVSRKLDPVKPGVVSVGKIEGGTRFNVIPDLVTLEGTLRWFHPETRDTIRKHLKQLIEGVAAAHGARARLDYEIDEYPPVVNQKEPTDYLRAAAEEVVGGRAVLEQDPTMGAEDMSLVLQRVPGCYWFLGSANGSRGLDRPHHSGRFDFDERALEIGVEIWLRLVRRML